MVSTDDWTGLSQLASGNHCSTCRLATALSTERLSPAYFSMIYVLVPAYNEAATVGLLLWKVRQVFTAFPREYQLLVVDDASTDGTDAVLAPYARALPLTLVTHRQRQGYARSLEELLRLATSRTDRPRRDLAVVLQADFSDPPDDIPEMVKRIESGADLVLADYRPAARAAARREAGPAAGAAAVAAPRASRRRERARRHAEGVAPDHAGAGPVGAGRPAAARRGTGGRRTSSCSAPSRDRRAAWTSCRSRARCSRAAARRGRGRCARFGSVWQALRSSPKAPEKLRSPGRPALRARPRARPGESRGPAPAPVPSA